MQPDITTSIVLGLAGAVIGLSALDADRRCKELHSLRIPVANLDEASRLSQTLDRYFDCLEYEVETSTLQTCEEE